MIATIHRAIGRLAVSALTACTLSLEITSIGETSMSLLPERGNRSVAGDDANSMYPTSWVQGLARASQGRATGTGQTL